MWTNKQVWEFEQTNGNLKFDVLYAESEFLGKEGLKPRLSYPNSDLRDIIIKTFDNLVDGYYLWVTNKGQDKLEVKFVPYVMADIMIDEEICLNFKIENDCVAMSIDAEADIIDCKEFFEEFYHLATGFKL